MASEVSDALSWCLDHCGEFGGDTGSIALIGHSAGGHLAAMALLLRATAAVAVPSKPPGVSPADAMGIMGHIGASFEADDGDAMEGDSGGARSGAEWTADAVGRAGIAETASYLHGAGTSPSDVAASIRMALHAEVPVPNSLTSSIDSHVITDSRMPSVFVSMAGVYDIAKVGGEEQCEDDPVTTISHSLLDQPSICAFVALRV